MSDSCDSSQNYLRFSIQTKVSPVLICAALSLVISGFFLGIALLMKLYKEHLFKIIMWIQVTGLIFTSLPFIRLALARPNNSMCTVYASIEMYWAFASLFWCCCFSHALYTATKNHSLTNLNRRFWKYLAIAHVCPLAFAVPLYMINTELYCFDTKINHCQINLSQANLPILLITSLPWLASSVYMIAMYLKIRREMNISGVMIKLRVFIYPAILFACWAPLMSGYLLAYLDIRSPVWLVCIYTSSIYLNGFLNTIIYGLSRRVRTEIQKFCRGKKDTERNYMMSLLDDSRLSGNCVVSLVNDSKEDPSAFDKTLYLSTLRASLV